MNLLYGFVLRAKSLNWGWDCHLAALGSHGFKWLKSARNRFNSICIFWFHEFKTNISTFVFSKWMWFILSENLELLQAYEQSFSQFFFNLISGGFSWAFGPMVARAAGGLTAAAASWSKITMKTEKNWQLPFLVYIDEVLILVSWQ